VVIRNRGLGGNIMGDGAQSSAAKLPTPNCSRKRVGMRSIAWSPNASLMHANAIIMMRFDSAEIGQTMSEIVAYGTAAVLEPAV
jgi:hypothetical protein